MRPGEPVTFIKISGALPPLLLVVARIIPAIVYSHASPRFLTACAATPILDRKNQKTPVLPCKEDEGSQ
jgi:hypothetical protein